MITVASTFAKRSRAARGAREHRGATQAAQIELSGVTKRFVTPSGSMFTALRDIDLAIGAGKFCAVVGPTGCGKSTTLTMVAGLDRPSAGTVRVGGQVVDGIAAGTSFMFQADALMPWKTVLGNVALGPVFRGVPKKGSAVPGARLGAPGRLGRLRGASPASALGGNAQAGEPSRRANKRAIH